MSMFPVWRSMAKPATGLQRDEHTATGARGPTTIAQRLLACARHMIITLFSFGEGFQRFSEIDLVRINRKLRTQRGNPASCIFRDLAGASCARIEDEVRYAFTKFFHAWRVKSACGCGRNPET